LTKTEKYWDNVKFFYVISGLVSSRQKGIGFGFPDIARKDEGITPEGFKRIVELHA